MYNLLREYGEARAKTLNRLGIFTLEDLITYYPRDYEDRGKIKKISDVIDGENALISAFVISNMQVIKTSNKKMTICRLVVKDETDSIEIIWYNQPYLKSNFRVRC